MKQSTHRRTRRRRRSPSLPELEQAMAAVLNTLASLQSRRSYRRAMEEFISWYCSEPRLALNRSVVLRYRLRLESMRLAASTINVRLAAVRRLATEAADSGLLSPDLIAGIRRVRGVKQLGRRMGNWLTAEEGHRLLSAVSTETLRGKRDAAMLGLLIGSRAIALPNQGRFLHIVVTQAFSSLGGRSSSARIACVTTLRYINSYVQIDSMRFIA